MDKKELPFQEKKRLEREQSIESRRVRRQDPEARKNGPRGIGSKRNFLTTPPIKPQETAAPAEIQPTEIANHHNPYIVLCKDHIEISEEARKRYDELSNKI